MRHTVLTCCLLGILALTACSQDLPNCPDPVAESDEPMTEQEKKLARLKTGFDPSCKND